KSLLVAGVAMILSNNVFADEGHGIVKFKGEVISAPCSIKPGDEDLTVNLGEVADTVLKSDQKSLAEPFTIHLQDCMLSQGGTTYSKAKVTFTTANTMTGQTDLLKNTKETEIGGATGGGVRILDSQSGEVTLGTPVVITFNNTNSYQELNFSSYGIPSKDATPGNVYAQADYKIAYSNHIRPGSPGHIINGLMISGTDIKN
ncbi:fimbrial-like protein, partial [Escherichia coli]|nr:fimbrial-like protein [Escherichia coli]